MAHTVDREAQRSAVGALVGATEQHIHAAEIGTPPQELDHLVVIPEAFEHGALEPRRELKGLELGGDPGGDLETLHLGRRVAVAPEQLLKRAGPLLDAGVAAGQARFREQEVRLQAHLRMFIRCLGQLTAGFEQCLPVTVVVLKPEQLLAGPEIDPEDGVAVGIRRRGLDQCLPLADHPLAGTAFGRRRRVLAGFGQFGVERGDLLPGDAGCLRAWLPGGGQFGGHQEAGQTAGEKIQCC